MRRLSRNVVSALACDIDLGSAGVGVLMMQSDRHDIIPEVHSRLFRRITAQTEDAIAAIVG